MNTLLMEVYDMAFGIVETLGALGALAILASAFLSYDLYKQKRGGQDVWGEGKNDGAKSLISGAWLTTGASLVILGLWAVFDVALQFGFFASEAPEWVFWKSSIIAAFGILTFKSIWSMSIETKGEQNLSMQSTFDKAYSMHNSKYQTSDRPEEGTAKITPEIKEMVENNPIAFSTADESGGPNVIAVGPVKVVLEDMVLIADNYMYQTKKNLEKNNKVCLGVWDNSLIPEEWRGYKLIGTANYFTQKKWREFADKREEFREKWLMAKGVVLVTIKKIIKLG